jgi:hypothetical protein
MSIFMVKRSISILASAIMLVFVSGIAPVYADCPKGEAACPSGLGGGCAPMGSICCPGSTHAVIGAACPGEQTGDWGAVVVVTWSDKSGNSHVAFGMGLHQKTISQASSAALLDCQNDSGELCQIVGTFNNGGCGYISIGSGSNNVRWAISDTSDQALKQCSSGGDTCKTPVGGCTNK